MMNTKCGFFLPKQVICLEKIFANLEVLAVLPTGYGKSLIFCLLPALMFAKKNGVKCPFTKISSIIIVVSPYALIANQISRLNSGIIQAAALDVNYTAKDRDEDDTEDELLCSFALSDRAKLEQGWYNILFAHPESLMSCAYGRKLMNTEPYQENVCAIVVDEAHSILEWYVKLYTFITCPHAILCKMRRWLAIITR